MRYIIIGNGAAGNAAAAAIRERDPAGEVLIYSAEPEPAYYRPLIVNLISEDINKDISFAAAPIYPAEAGAYLGQGVARLEAAEKLIILENGQRCAYDRLLLATGAAAIVPDLPGWTGLGAHVLRTMADGRAVAEAAAQARQAVVIGAGRVGLKAAMALRQRGLAVTLVEQEARVAHMQFDPVAGEILAAALEAQGFHLAFGQTVTGIGRAAGRIQSVTLGDGRALPAQLVVAALGVRPNAALARQAGLEVRRGVVVDEKLRTSAPEIYAAGDVAETADLLTGQPIVSGLWTNAVEMGRLAGANMAGAARAYPGAFAVLNSLEVAGIPTVAIGLTNPPPGDDCQVLYSRRGRHYRKLVFKAGALVGALLVGDIDGAGVYAGLMRGRAKLSELQHDWAQPRLSLAARLGAHISRG